MIEGPGLEHFFSVFRAEKFHVDVKEGPGREGRSDLNVQLTLSGGKVNMSTAPDRIQVKRS